MMGTRRTNRGGAELAVEEPRPEDAISSPAETRGPEATATPAADISASPRKRRFARSRTVGAKTLSDRFAFLRPDSPVPVYIGIVLVLAGFAVIGLTWGKVAGLLLVPLQLPYLVSGGLTGLGLIMVGITVISIGAKRRDAAERGRQLEQLAAIMNELRSALRDGSDE